MTSKEKIGCVAFHAVAYPIAFLQRRLHWVATVVVAGLAVLVFHLALYPWPDLP